jgi:ComF family protein
MKFFSWILESIFPPRATQLLVHDAFLQRLNHKSVLRTLLRVQTIFIQEVPITALLPYRSPLVQACILEAKFHKNREAQELLGTFLATYIKVSNLSGNVTILPIPLGKKRRKARGYNQSEEIARFSGEIVDSSALQRVRETHPQTTLGRKERLTNIRGAFLARTPLDSQMSYILLDDVVTTGATLLSAYEALKMGGATSIYVIALAH